MCYSFASSARFPLRLVASLLLCAFLVGAATKPNHAERIASLIHPAKLATLRERGAIPRVQKVVYQLEIARREQADVGVIIDHALRQVNMTNRLAAKLTKETLLRNLSIASRLGCLTEEGLSEMKQGKSPTIAKGPYIGDQLSVDHIVPLDVAPELDHVMANLELMPARMNSAKRAKIGARQRDFAKSLYDAGLLSARGYRAVLAEKAKAGSSK